MNNYGETVSKFLSSLHVDTVKEVRYVGKVIGDYYCVCGQPIKYGYTFTNTRNGRTCTIGKRCLSYVADYLGWNDKKTT